ncbi:MAG: HlyD family efflux transporter periplasmic adaptor subunit [Gloeomargarita sp. SKYBB_i_bin120]|nr:HlyD family secretion protein [Gloeomargarita sp. SKYG98]MCS7291825.1 HlyD family secretion protein [Gloeomargarita sp. SKYB120]MDW8177385.1 HlyD family efflux transporter periplasmic adaptor subunit [Gloeomargarita sp. SKYBB_i_bin120]
MNRRSLHLLPGRWLSGPLPPPSPLKPQEAGQRRQRWFRALRLILGMGLLGLAVGLGWQRLTRVTSRVGYVNAEVITVHAPITGTLRLEPLQPGMSLPQGAVIGVITNERNAQLEIELQHLRSRLRLAEQQYRSLGRRLAQRQQTYALLTQKSRQQSALDVEFFQAALERSRSELRAAQAQLAFAQQELERVTALAREGAIPQQRVDQARTELRLAQEQVANRQADVQRQWASLQAIKKGLQLDSARTFSFPAIRLLDLSQEITDLEQEQRQLETTLHNLRQEIRKTERQLQLVRSATLRSPAATVVWSVGLRTGELGTHVEAGTPLLQLLNCEQVWVSALVAERANHRLFLGQRAIIRFLDGTHWVLPGWVRAIRGGPGQVTVGVDVAVPPPELVRNELEVQVELTDPWRLQERTGRFCGVGQRVEVEFLTEGA